MNIESYSGWDDFFQRFKHTPRGQSLAALLPKGVLKTALSPVLSIARVIHEEALTPSNAGHYNLLWIGAELPELTDQGRWFGLLPELLEVDGTVSITFAESKVKPFNGPNPRVLEVLPPATLDHIETGSISSGEYDLVVVSHPDMVTKWRSLPEFDVKVPVIALYWSALDAAMERVRFAHCGRRVKYSDRNVFDIENRVDTTASWGRFVDTLLPAEPVYDVSEKDLQALGMLRHHSGIMGFGHPAGQPGRPRKNFMVRSGQSDDEYLYILDDLFLNLANRTLYRFNDQSRQLTPLSEVAGHLLQNRPKANTDILDAFKWAAAIKLSYALLPPEKEKDALQIHQWLAESADQGDINAAYALGLWIEAGYIEAPSPAAAERYYRIAAAGGHASGQYAVADRLFHEHRQVEEARKFFEAAAEQEYALAMFNLAVMHLEGMIAGASPVEGVNFARRAAEQNEVNAQALLAEFYAKAGNAEEAINWYAKAADRGLIEAAGAALDLMPQITSKAPQKQQRALKKQAQRYKRMLRMGQRAQQELDGGS